MSTLARRFRPLDGSAESVLASNAGFSSPPASSASSRFSPDAAFAGRADVSPPAASAATASASLLSSALSSAAPPSSLPPPYSTSALSGFSSHPDFVALASHVRLNYAAYVHSKQRFLGHTRTHTHTHTHTHTPYSGNCPSRAGVGGAVWLGSTAAHRAGIAVLTVVMLRQCRSGRCCR